MQQAIPQRQFNVPQQQGPRDSSGDRFEQVAPWERIGEATQASGAMPPNATPSKSATVTGTRNVWCVKLMGLFLFSSNRPRSIQG